MNLLDALTVDVGLYLVNVAAAVTLACALGMTASRLLRSRPAPVRYGLLLAALLLALGAPGVVRIGSALGICPLRVPIAAPEEQAGPAAPVAEPEPIAPRMEGPVPVASETPVEALPAEAVSVEPPETPARAPIPWSRLLVAAAIVVWAVGTAIGLAVMARGLVLVWRLRDTLRPTDDRRLAHATTWAARVLGLSRTVEVRLSPFVPVPLSMGLVRPVIVFPEAMVNAVEEADLQAIILHEAAHVAHRDHWVGLLQRLALALFWWNPLVRMLSGRLSEAREEVCDNYVVRAHGDGVRFARFLLDVAGRTVACRRLTAAIGLVHHPRRGLEARLRKLLTKERNTMTRMNLTAVALVGVFTVCIGGVMLGCNLGAAKPESPGEAVAETDSPSAPAAATKDPTQGTAVRAALLAKSPIRSLREYRHFLRITAPPAAPPLYRPAHLPACDFEIRSERNPTRVARIPYGGYFRQNGEPGGPDRRRIGDLPDGDYLVALCVGQTRLSNVARLRIDSAFDAKKGPALELVPLPLASDGGLRYVGLVATGREKVDPEFTNMAAAFPALLVDGVERPLVKAMKWAGPVGPLQPGQRDVRFIDLSNYGLEIAPEKTHRVRARVGMYESAEVTVPATGALGREWDEKTARLPSVRPPRVVLRGKVIGPAGQPAAGYEVGLSAPGGGHFRERCDEKGQYQFVNVPAGQYQLNANPPGKGQPIVTIDKVQIRADGTLVRDLSLEAKFGFSGKVVYEDGAPAAGAQVMATWPSPDGTAEFGNFATVGPDGRYTVRSPYPEASYVGISMTGPHPDPKRGVKDGRTDVDFVMPRFWGNAVEGVACRLRPQKRVWRTGQTPIFRVDLRNKGTRHLKTDTGPMSWEIELDGAWYHCTTTVLIRIAPIPLEPGRQHDNHGRRFTGDIWRSKDGDKPLEFTLGRHTVRVAFTARATKRNAGPPVRAVSNPVEIEIVPAKPGNMAEKTTWGPATEGVECRLLPQKSAWKAGQTPQLQADLRNRGKRELSMGLAPESWEVQYDGVWYRSTASFRGRVEALRLKPGGQRNGISLLLEDRWKWRSKDRKLGLVFRPGKHTLRAAFRLRADDGSQLRVVSNPVEIEIVPADKLAVESLKKLGWRPMEKTNLIWDGNGRVSSIDLFAPSRDVPVTDAWLVPLKRMSELRILNLGNTQITDTGLAHLSGLTKLQRLELTGTKVTDAGLVHLERLTSLKSLFLASTSVTKEGAERLKRALPNAEVFLGEATNEVTGEPAEGAAFGPVTERTVAYREGFPSEAVAEPGPMYLDLDTGAYAKFKTLPDSKMIREAGVDVYCEPSADGGGMRLATSNMQVQPFSGKTVWNSSPAHVHRALMIGSPYHLAYTEKSTLAVRTGDGGIGILQIVGFTKDRRGIRIRYKMLQRPKAGTSATAPATQPADESAAVYGADADDPADISVNVANSPRVTVDLINAVGIEERPSFWIGRERLTREALLDRLGELRDKSPTLQVAIRHTASTAEKELTALRQSLARLNIQDVSIGRHDLPHVFAYPNAKHKGTIRGRVVDAHPTVPSPKYDVMLWHKNWGFGENPSLVVGAGEAFEFRNVGPGDYELRTREWRPNGRVVHFGADWTYVQTKAAVEDGKVAEVQVVFGKGDTGRWNDAYTWGEAADGVIMRVTRAKFTIAPGEKIALHVDICNGGKIDRKIVLNHENWELEIDGRWLKESGGASSGRAVGLLKPKQPQHDIDVWVWLGENMTRAIEGLPPGKHTLRVAHLLNGEGRSSNDPPQLRVVSQPVIIEVVAKDEGKGIGAADSTGVEPEDGRAVLPTRITVRGKVVDDATGNPVADFVTESGKFDPADPAKVVWGYSETRSSRKSGQFSATVRWSEGWTARIVAPGYLPQPVLTQPPSPGQDVIEVVIRLKRGDTIRGRVLDHTGQGVAKAGVYLAGRGVIRLAEGPWDEFQQATVHTDAEGRFEISGRGTDSKAIFVTAPSLFVWRADLPEPGQEAIIRLPEPARLQIRYDIEGGPPAAQVRIELRTWDMPKWKALVDVVRWVHIKAGEDGLVVDNLPPGVYDISRIKRTRAGNSGKDMMLDRQLKLTLASGKTTAYDFVRKTGTPITGDVVGLPKEGVNGVFLYVRDQRVSGDPRQPDEWRLRTFDGLALEGNGPFQTERIPPGKYKVVVEAYRQEKRGEMSGTGWRLPKWIGTARVNVPESGEPPKVRLMMRPYDAQTGQVNIPTPPVRTSDKAVQVETVPAKPAAKSIALPQPKRAPRKLFSARCGQDAGILAVAFSPDGRTLAAVDEQGKVMLRDASSGGQKWARDVLTPEEKRLLLYEDRQGRIHTAAIAFSPDGYTLAVAADPVVRLYDAQSGRLQRVLEDKQLIEALKELNRPPATVSRELETLKAVPHAHGRVYCLAFSPDGTLLATSGSHLICADGSSVIDAEVATHGKLKLWDAKTGKLKRDLGEHYSAVRSVAFSRDGKTLASIGSHPPSWTSGVRLWDPQTGAVKSVVPTARGMLKLVAFSPDGKLMATSTFVREADPGNPGSLPGRPCCKLLVWNARTGELLFSRRVPALVTSLSFSADGKTLATAVHRRGVILWDPETLKSKGEIQPSTDPPRDVQVAFSPTGNLLAVGAKNEKHGFVTVWQIGQP